jgi:hypothetical protein
MRKYFDLKEKETEIGWQYTRRENWELVLVGIMLTTLLGLAIII